MSVYDTACFMTYSCYYLHNMIVYGSSVSSSHSCRVGELKVTVYSLLMNYWRSERSERRHIQVMTIEICDIYNIYIYKYVKFYHKCTCTVILAIATLF